jgi:flagellar biosynthesis/type III secretory pathway M-ring protein FliF/YscJ
MMAVSMTTVSVKMIGFKTLKELTRRAQMRERQARIKIKIMNWLIVILCLVIIFVGITGCVGFNG